MEQEASESQTQEFQDVEPQEVDTTDGENVEQSETENLEPDTQVVESEVVEPVEAAVEEEEFNPTAYETPQLPQVQPIDINQFVDANGQVDMIGYNRAMVEFTNAQVQAAVQTAVAQSTQTMTLQTKYQSEWNKAEEAYPQLKKDAELRDMVRDIHAQSATPGRKYLSPAKAAERVFGRLGQVKAEGAKSAQQTRTTQAAAALTNPNPPVDASESKSTSNLRDKMRYGNKSERQNATTQLIAKMIENGQL